MVCDHIIIAIQSDIQREGIQSIIQKNFPDCKSLSVKNKSNAIDLYKDKPHSICLLSIPAFNPEVESFLSNLHEINPNRKSVSVIPSANTDTIERALRAGINGLLTQHCTSKELVKVLSEVASGRNSYSRAISEVMMRSYRNRQLQRPVQRKQVTKRESEVLSLIVKGYTSAEIAKKLFISPRTVETHRCNLMGKLKLKNTAALVRFALQERNTDIS